MAMLVKHEPGKAKHAKLLTEHLARHRIMAFTEEELQQHLERKAKRESKNQFASIEAEALRQEQVTQAAAAQHAHNTGIIATFAKRAKEAAIAP
jgi:hypothetical protein